MCTDFRQSPAYQQLFRQGGSLVAPLNAHEVAYVARMRFVPFMSLMVLQRIRDCRALATAQQLARRNRCLFIKVAPKVALGSDAAAEWEQTLQQHKYRWDKSAVAPTKTILVDLSCSASELLQQMKSKTRYNIRLSGRRGVTTEVVDGRTAVAQPDYLHAFHTIYRENCERIGMPAGPPEMLGKICEAFGENLLFVYGYDSTGEVTAVASYTVAGDTIYYQMNGSTERGRRDFATNRVVWEGMLAGQERGCRWFDFDGVYDERYPEDEDWQGFSRFKAGFGGEEVTYLGSYVKWLPFLR